MIKALGVYGCEVTVDELYPFFLKTRIFTKIRAVSLAP